MSTSSASAPRGNRVSHKRRRTRLEMGVVGCCSLLLSSPTVKAAAASATAAAAAGARHSSGSSGGVDLGVVHSSIINAPPTPAGRRREDSTSVSTLAATTATPLHQHAQLPSDEALRRIAVFPSRHLKGVDAHWYVSFGEWGQCSGESCTQKRQVICETVDHQRVSDDLCGDNMVMSERACNRQARGDGSGSNGEDSCYSSGSPPVAMAAGGENLPAEVADGALEGGVSQSKGKDPNLVGLERLGDGTSGPSRADYRFWTVLAIGAGAVGSFLAVVVFAIGQYKKEQHRCRGLTPLNEFPQDNYINPFANSLSEDDRTVFRL